MNIFDNMSAFLGWPPYYLATLTHILVAALVGGAIGIERSYNGRPAGFRTHTLVCIASSILMLLTVYQVELLPDIPIETIRIDPTRMAQGIMTGIGFLGAGVIMKEGLTVRGLTTAASIWITASIGILIGVGFYFAAVAATLLTLGVLAIFRPIEAAMPTLHYGRLSVRSQRSNLLSESDLSKLIQAHDFTHSEPSYHLSDEGKFLEYAVTLRTRDIGNYGMLAESLANNETVAEFELRPVGN